MEGVNSEVISVTVRNKFGEAGLTGIVFLHFDGKTAQVDNFLMSCRVLGQGVEFAMWAFVANRCRARGCTTLAAQFQPTAKNAQVADFWDRLGLKPVGDERAGRRYSVTLKGFAPPPSPWIDILHD